MTHHTIGTTDLRAAAQAVVDRWDTPLWKDAPSTAEYIGRLRTALASAAAQQPWQYTPPAQERIDALELEVRQLTEQIAELRHAPTPQADSVLEDAARYQWIRGPGEESTRYSRWNIEYWDGPNGWQPMQRESMDNAIDAARKQGANHDI